LDIREANTATDFVSIKGGIPGTGGVTGSQSMLLGMYGNSSGSGSGLKSIYTYDSANGTALALMYSNTSAVLTEGARLTTGGNFGIGTSTASKTLTVTGTVQFASLNGNSTLQTDAVGNVTNTSDERLKNISGPFTRGLEDIQKIIPISYHWKDSTGFDTGTLYSGFSAQNVQSAIPEAVGQNSANFLTLSDRPLIAAAINAIKDLASRIATLAAKVDGIFVSLTTDKVTTKELCVDDVCVTKDQFRMLLDSAHVIPTIPTPTPVITPTPDATSTATTTSEVDSGDSATSTPDIVLEVVPEPTPVEETPPVETPAQ
jgi:hypothetical protein